MQPMDRENLDLDGNRKRKRKRRNKIFSITLWAGKMTHEKSSMTWWVKKETNLVQGLQKIEKEKK